MLQPYIESATALADKIQLNSFINGEATNRSRNNSKWCLLLCEQNPHLLNFEQADYEGAGQPTM